MEKQGNYSVETTKFTGEECKKALEDQVIVNLHTTLDSFDSPKEAINELACHEGMVREYLFKSKLYDYIKDTLSVIAACLIVIGLMLLI